MGESAPSGARSQAIGASFYDLDGLHWEVFGMDPAKTGRHMTTMRAFRKPE